MSLKHTLQHWTLGGLARLDRTPRYPLREVKTFIILQHTKWLGAAIHCTPLIPALRAAVPDAEIVLATRGYGAEVFQGNPDVNRIMPVPNPGSDFRGAVRELRKVVQEYSARPFITLVPLGVEYPSKYALAAWLAGASNRVGFTEAPELYRLPLPFDRGLSQIENNLRIVSALGFAPPVTTREPRVFFSADETAHARSLLPGRDESKPLVALVTQTYKAQRKGWRAERFAATGRFLAAQFGAEIVFVGTQRDREAIELIRAQIPGRTWNVAGQTNIRQLTALFDLCTVGLTLDTGTMHVGRAAGLPMVVIAPAWSPPLEWLPVNNPRYIILKNADIPAETEDYIIDEVSVDDANAAMATLLRSHAAERLARQRLSAV